MLVTSWEMLARREGLRQGNEEGLQKGLQKGLQEGRASLLLDMLTHRFGQLSLRLQNQISRLTTDELGELGLVMANFTQIKELRDWLARHKSQPAKNGNSKTRISLPAKRKK